MSQQIEERSPASAAQSGIGEETDRLTNCTCYRLTKNNIPADEVLVRACVLLVMNGISELDRRFVGWINILKDDEVDLPAKSPYDLVAARFFGGMLPAGYALPERITRRCGFTLPSFDGADPHKVRVVINAAWNQMILDRRKVIPFRLPA